MYHFMLFFLNLLKIFHAILSNENNTDADKSTIISSREFTFSTENPFLVRNNSSDFSWLGDALKDIAYYLRGHKFNEYDRRYHADALTATRDYFGAFPSPPLRSLHWEVHKYCEPSFISCVEYLVRRIKNTGLRRSDDTTIVIQEQQWNGSEYAKQIAAVEDECRKLLKTDDVLANPFEGPIERFQWRTTASYYMCWYALSEVPNLSRLKENCDNFANCFDTSFGVNNGDPRAKDGQIFACALYSFCPDPCCQIRHLKTFRECWSSTENPCFVNNSIASSKCTVNRSRNTNFADIVLNRWNVTCECSRKGFEWDSKYGMCVDIDECLDGLHGCDTESEACVNLKGSFRCACLWGYAWNSSRGSCQKNPALEIIEVNSNATEENLDDKKAKSIVKLLKAKLFQKSSSVRLLGSSSMTFVTCSLFLIKFANCESF